MAENDEKPTDETAIGSAADEAANSAVDDAGTDGDPAGSEALGDAGKRALDAMKAKLRAERTKRQELERKIADQGDASEADKVRAKAEREVLAKVNKRIIRTEIKAAAAGKFNDVSDVFAYIKPEDFEVDDSGNVDETEISAAIEDLLKRKPYLGAKNRPRFQGTGDGGSQRQPAGPSQLTKDDLKGMTPEAIVKAKAEGRLKNLLSGK